MNRDVFICYSRKDKAVAEATCRMLESEGIGCWIAPRDISPGGDWGEGIIDGINHSKVLVLIFSSNANTDQSQIKREIERAVHKDVPIIPFRIENVEPARSLEYFLSTPHWLDAFQGPIEDHYRPLVDAVRFLQGITPAAHVADAKASAVPAQSSRHQFSLSNRAQTGPGSLRLPPLRAVAFAGAVVAAVAIVAAVMWWQNMVSPNDRVAWETAAKADTIPAYEIYLREEADGHFAEQAQDRTKALQNAIESAWSDAQNENTIKAMQAFIVKYNKDGLHIADAWAAIHLLQQDQPPTQTQSPEALPETSAEKGGSQAQTEASGVQPNLTLNCGATSFADEKTICNNAGLTALNKRMAAAFAALKIRQPNGILPQDVVSYALAATSKRHECSTDVDCISASLLAEKAYYEGYQTPN